jgi:hypothetical protein
MSHSITRITWLKIPLSGVGFMLATKLIFFKSGRDRESQSIMNFETDCKRLSFAAGEKRAAIHCGHGFQILMARDLARRKREQLVLA